MERVAVALSVALGLACVASADVHPVAAELVADAQVREGGVSRVGVRLVMAPGWHVYWENPGDSGLATEVLWAAPDSVSIGPLRWPLPERFSSPGEVESFGYADQVLLASEVRWPDAVVSGAIRARVSWLACRDICLLGEAELRADLPLPPAVLDPAAFRGYEGSLPRELGDGPAPFSVHLDETGQTAMRRLWLRWLDDPRDAEVFPLWEGDGRVRVLARTRGRLTRIDLELLGSPPTGLTVVVAARSEGRRSGVRVPIPARAGASHRPPGR